MRNRSRREGLLCISFCNFLFKSKTLQLKLSEKTLRTPVYKNWHPSLACLIPWRPEENASTLLYPRISSILQLVSTMASSDFFHHKGQWLLTKIDKVSAEQTDIAGQKEILMLPSPQHLLHSSMTWFWTRKQEDDHKSGTKSADGGAGRDLEEVREKDWTKTHSISLTTLCISTERRYKLLFFKNKIKKKCRLSLRKRSTLERHNNL